MPNRKKSLPSFFAFAVNLSKDLTTVDHHMAKDFLLGRPPGLVQNRDYFVPGGKDEAAARDALLRVLRSDERIPPTIRKLLADLLDPAAKCERKITFEFRGKTRGRHPDLLMAHAVGSYFELRREQRISYKQTIAEIRQNLDLGPTQVSKYLKAYRNLKLVHHKSD